MKRFPFSHVCRETCCGQRIGLTFFGYRRGYQSHLGCYGDPHAITPHLDQLAKEGTVHPYVYHGGRVRSVSSGIITGMCQTTLGTHMRCRAQLPEKIRPFTQYLREASCYCEQFQNGLSVQRAQRHLGSVQRKSPLARSQGSAVFAVFNHRMPKAGLPAKENTSGDSSCRKTPAGRRETSVPPYRIPVVRELERNYELITAMDAWAGRLIAQLKRTLADSDHLFWSDHGVGAHGAKRWLYVRYARAVDRARADGKPAVSERMVSSIDFGPTVLKLTGLRAQACAGPVVHS